MDRLPEEIIIQILSFFEPQELRPLQQVSRYFLSVARDGTLWKTLCFEYSRQETFRRRQQRLSAQDASLDTLRRAMNTSMPGLITDTSTSDAFLPHESAHGKPEGAALSVLAKRTRIALANWDPSYPNEQPDFCEEFRQRHAPITLSWLQPAMDGKTHQPHESIGMAVFGSAQSSSAQRTISPLEDGSLCIWDVELEAQSQRISGGIVARSVSGLLSDSAPGPSISTGNRATFSKETGAVENTVVDVTQQKAYIAVHNQLHEVDLNTLQVIRQRSFPFPITALSAASFPIPLTVGTDNTLHLHDIREQHQRYLSTNTTRCELIGGSAIQYMNISPASFTTRVALSQPGPLSILHLPDGCSPHSMTDSIWVAGRFTSLLTYDRRFWPRISGTLFSGARLSSLTHLPFPYIPRELHNDQDSASELLAAKAGTGSTLVAAGAYKGKGSLELYSASSRATAPTVMNQEYRNRQTASKSRLLSVTAHGTRLVFSDGDGNLKWVERDGSTLVRNFNINDASPSHSQPVAQSRTRPSNMFPSTAESEEGFGDIVQKIVSCNPTSTRGSCPKGDDLIIWTGDGRLGHVGFGRSNQLSYDDGKDTTTRGGEVTPDVVEEEENYAQRMREALERQAHETRFVRDLGLGF